MRRILPILFLIIVLVACGGGGNEPAANSSSNTDAANADTNAAVEEDASQVDASQDSATEANAEAVDAAEQETVADADEPSGDAASAEEGGEALLSGIDPDTGLEINPDPIPYGTDFIVRGEVIQMNLTPQTEPEFVIRAANGLTYRIATQGLADVFLLDGGQLKPFEYKNGMEAMATAFLPPDASLSDVLTSSDFVIIALP